MEINDCDRCTKFNSTTAYCFGRMARFLSMKKAVQSEINDIDTCREYLIFAGRGSRVDVAGIKTIFILTHTIFIKQIVK